MEDKNGSHGYIQYQLPGHDIISHQAVIAQQSTLGKTNVVQRFYTSSLDLFIQFTMSNKRSWSLSYTFILLSSQVLFI